MSTEKKMLSFPKEGVPVLVSNDWHIWYGEQEQSDVESDMPDLAQGSSKLLLPFSWWRTHYERYHQESELMTQAKKGHIGVWFAADDDILKHAKCIEAGKVLWPVVAAHFPIFRDGRSFSTAALLRDRIGWQGQVRAIGDVLIDQLLQGARVGFDAFDLRPDQNLDVALAQFDLFSVATQNSWRGKRTQLAA
jgi:uncharacterized protein (DUF934 family)